MSGTNDDNRAGSADSEHSSDSFVQVSKEDAPAAMSEQLVSVADSEPLAEPTGSGIPPIDDREDIYGADEEATSAPTDKEEFDVNFMESKEPEFEEPKQPEAETTPPTEETPPPPISSSSGVEDVPKLVESTTEPSITSTAKPTEVSVPVPSGYLCFLHHLSPLILYVIYWRDIKLSAVVLGVCLMTLLTLSLNTFIHTLVLIQLSFLVVTLTYIVTKIAIDSFYNRDIANPFKSFLSSDIVLPEEKIVEWTRYSLQTLQVRLNAFVKLMLFHNIKRSLKYGVCLWLLSFVTNYITVLTALFLDVAVLFTVPVLYEKFQPVIDKNINKVLKIACETFNKVRSYIPSYIPIIGKPKVE